MGWLYAAFWEDKVLSETPPIALVTGGGTGIGSACCRSLSAAGFRVGVHYRNSKPGADALVGELSNAFAIQADLKDPDSIDTMIKFLKDEEGRVDVLVNNAGDNRNGPTPSMKLEDYDAVASLTRGTWYLTKLILRRFMLRQKNSRIINITSVVGHTGNRGQSPYTMAKAGLDAFSKSLAKELSGRPILVNSVAPGFIKTDMTDQLPEEIRESILSQIPLERMGTAEEVAEAVVWLATNANYVHGTVIHVNGGMYGG